MKTYKYITLSEAQDLINRYESHGGEAITVEEGCLGLGTVILQANGHNLKEFIIEEYYLNEWSSGHRLKVYTKGLPKYALEAVDRALECMEA